MKTTILLIACALLMTFSFAHDLTHNEEHLVMGIKWYNWFTDGFKLLMWVVAAIAVYPIGAIACLFGFPDVYTKMYSSVVNGFLKLAAY
jgi:hypothetical protein